MNIILYENYIEASISSEIHQITSRFIADCELQARGSLLAL